MSLRRIHINLPINGRSNNCLFQRRSYVINPLNILELNDIIATHEGLIFKNSQIITESVQNYPDKIKIFELEGRLKLRNFHKKHYTGNTLYLLIHHPWLNYYHWLTEAIPRLWSVRDVLNEMILLLPEKYKEVKFVQESLKPFRHLNLEYIPDNYNASVKHAIIPQIKPFCSNYDPDVVNDIKTFYIEYARKCKIIPQILNKRLYIIRGDSMRRRIINEEEVIYKLDDYDFKSIKAQSYSFYEQILFSENTDYLISNGSGLTNMHFMKERTSVLELQKKRTNINDFHDKVLWYLASVLNLRYYYLSCKPVNRHQDMYTANLKINLKSFEKVLIKMLNEKV
jgi:capsular polysaccharide biosynthesis protein